MPTATPYFNLPSASLFKFPPSNEPYTLAPPSIPTSTYQAALDIRVPITIASVYAAIVFSLNAYNKSHGNKPWAISKTQWFFAFVVAHNVFLTVYSGWTFIGMFRALTTTFANPFTSADTLLGGLTNSVDSLCKLHGSSGLSSAVVYSPSGAQWVSTSGSHVFEEPSNMEMGRFWNEGLAFYGWFFYLSKFYEVLDTLIILAKGKRSSTLQTYHHAGAMLCMWAGIRYMSPPIWMFVFVNSFIHTLMYAYYTLTAFAVPVPVALKRSLTTIQIIQFLVGTSYAALHSFIGYRIPISIPITETLTTTLPSSPSEATGTVAALLKKVLGSDGKNNSPIAVREHEAVTGWETVHREVNCIDTSGQTFAIWLNVLYLAPLTFLFVRFFVKSYLKKAKSA